MAMILKNVDRLTAEARIQITTSADLLRQKLAGATKVGGEPHAGRPENG
jgi:hypothetical protein